MASVPADLVDLEFSEIGRDRHYLPGWFIAPAILFVVLAIAVFVL